MSVIGHLTAIAAVANGGYLVTPHIVDEVISADGTVISKADVSAKRQVISTEVANQVAKILTDGTDGDGGARAAGVDGYAVAAKTGTSQKFDILDANGNSYLRVSSTVAFAPSTEAGIAVILVADEPTSAVKYGSVVAAPYVSALLSDILPYLGCERRGDTDDKTVTDVVGMHVSSAKDVLEQEGFSARIVGDGAVVTLQVPAAGERVTSSLSEVLLYTENRAAETVRVPDVIGLSAVDANVKLADEGCNIRLLGLGGAPASGHATVAAQSPAADTEIQLGAVVTLTVVFPSEEEDE